MEAPCPEIEVFDDLTQDRSTSMTDQAVSPLRRRMIEDMTIRKFVAKTQHDYVQRVKDFAVFLGRSPSTASKEDVRRFQLHLASNGAGTPKMNVTAAALRFFFNVTLDRPDLAKQASFVHEPRKVPVVLSPEEVARFLEAAPGIKYKAALSVAYGAGLRVSEVAALKVTDIDYASARPSDVPAPQLPHLSSLLDLRAPQQDRQIVHFSGRHLRMQSVSSLGNTPLAALKSL